ncbi:GxxExxY protein [Parerythrobacter lacustris]|uniref:GxxExxY protein n=1 Tax=Parerythrobacter lacustris TaxID=2969984 RepID=A0ABT1XPS6_9SPHN|nr:GxxExxY protein [Parerythrobacter lacustris]
MLIRHCVDRGYRLHRDLGPGLLENVYESLLFEGLRRDGLAVLRQQSVPVSHDGIVIENGFRYDLLVEDKLLIEIKSTERHAAVHAKQVITYLRLLDLRIGLLMNFGMGTFKEGCQRLVNNYVKGQQ